MWKRKTENQLIHMIRICILHVFYSTVNKKMNWQLKVSKCLFLTPNEYIHQSKISNFLDTCIEKTVVRRLW